MNTPYAYAIVQGEDGRENVSLQFDHPEMCGQKYNAVIPLYTHPVKELKNIVVASATCSCGKVMEVTNFQPVKELTDEEIQQAIDGIDWNQSNVLIRFARAILKKAQENG